MTHLKRTIAGFVFALSGMVAAIVRAFRLHRRPSRRGVRRGRLFDHLEGEATPERLKAALTRRDAVAFHAEQPDDFGFDPEIIEAREKAVREGRFTPASPFFDGLRARIPSRR